MSWHSMKQWLAALLLLALAFDAAAQDPTGVAKKDTHEESFDYGRFGTLHTIVPNGPIKDVVLFAAGDGGWNPGVADMAQLIANEGALIIGFETVHYLDAINAGGPSCAYPAADFEALAHAVEKRYQLGDYIVPLLAGYSSGATLTHAVLAQAPQGTFRGAINLGFCRELALQRRLCPGRGVEFKQRKEALSLVPMKSLGAPWVVLQGDADQACTLDSVNTFAASIPTARVIALNKVGHGFSVGRHWHEQFSAAYRALVPPPKPVLAAAVSDLPLIEVPSAGKAAPYFAVLLTGDGGWAGLDQELATQLAQSGIPVAALNTLKYFWNERQPDYAARDLGRIIEHYVAQWHRQRVLLIGYSFGANVLPEMVTRMPQRPRTYVQGVNLIAPEHEAAFEIHVGGWFGKESEGQPIKPVLQTIASYRLPVTCIHGTAEESSLCAEVPPDVARNVVMPGGHHFNGDYARLVEVMLGGTIATTR
ncbi:MAG: AcvB/VirJ family lysyl-phosphatidylglycerol hydrolase [Steroidobacteraceae bacterium]